MPLWTSRIFPHPSLHIERTSTPDFNTDPRPSVVHSGYLLKRGHRLPTWSTRYFEICDNGLLTYFSSIGGTQKGSFQFNRWTVISSLSCPEDCVFGFMLRGNMTSLYLKAKFQEEIDQWIFELERLLKRIKGQLGSPVEVTSICDVDVV